MDPTRVSGLSRNIREAFNSEGLFSVSRGQATPIREPYQIDWWATAHNAKATEVSRCIAPDGHAYATAVLCDSTAPIALYAPGDARSNGTERSYQKQAPNSSSQS